MKKIVLLAFAFITYQNVFAVTNIYNWRWRNDDGDETTATWLANENTGFLLSNTNTNFRLRCEIVNENGSTFDIGNDTLLYSTSKSGPWIAILNTVGTNAFVLAGSASVSDLGPTTEQLSNEKGFSFVPGFTIVNSLLFAKQLLTLNKTEYEWVIRATPNTKTSTKYYFRPSGQGDPNFQTQGYPVLQTGTSLPIDLAKFTINPLGKSVKLDWTTASELNNDRFEILRSADGRTNWKVIGTVKGIGTSSKGNSYSFTDISPLTGINYYKLKQIDIDGKFQESDIKSISMQLLNSIFNVFPNPTKGLIQFTLSNYKGGDLKVLLTDINGKLIHTEVMKSNVENRYKLNLKSNPIPGMYILKVTGDDYEKSMKIQVQ